MTYTVYAVSTGRGVLWARTQHVHCSLPTCLD